MKCRDNSEFDKFDDAMGKLLSVPYAELKKKLDEEKEEKKRKKSISSSARVRDKRP